MGICQEDIGASSQELTLAKSETVGPVIVDSDVLNKIRINQSMNKQSKFEVEFCLPTKMNVGVLTPSTSEGDLI